MGFLYSQLFVTPTYPKKSFVGQTIIVTGSNTGLGKEAARHFARLGASKIILAVRNTQAGEEAKQDIESTTKCDHLAVEVWALDLSSYDSVKAFVNRASNLNRIDVLCESAGIATHIYSLAEGHERTITVNVISTFLLGLLLLPKLRSTAKDFNTKTCLTIVSSEAHAWARFPEWKESNVFKALDVESKSGMAGRYTTSKLLQILIIRQIASKLYGSDVIVNYLSPGLCHSGLFRHAGWLLGILKFFMARTTEEGSRTLVAAAEAGQDSHGKYMIDGKSNDEALSAFVESEDGEKAGKKIWNELSAILEEIQPGITKNL